MDEINERLARILDRTGDYRILRRVHPPVPSAITADDRAAAGLAIGIVLDTETTGLAADDEVVELGMVWFAYEPTFLRVERVFDAFSALRQPSGPISPDVRRLTGITDADVAGRSIDADRAEPGCILERRGIGPMLEDVLPPHLDTEAIAVAYRAAPGNELDSGKLASPDSSAELVPNALSLFIGRDDLLPPIAGVVAS